MFVKSIIELYLIFYLSSMLFFILSAFKYMKFDVICLVLNKYPFLSNFVVIINKNQANAGSTP